MHLSNHHAHLRKRKKAIDASAYIVGVAGNFAVIPQIIKSWSGPAPGLSVITWLLFVFIGLVWLSYAVMHKQKPLILAQSIGISCNVLVVMGWAIHNLS